jgi:hypothetical protein
VSGNPYASAARLRKVLALLAACDRYAGAAGLDAVRSSAAMARAIEDQSDLWWSALAEAAQVRPPSLETRAAVVEALRARAERLPRLRLVRGGRS